ncbi:MAG TPA: hypothetical protein GX693_00470, partial [Firmicutes bacterium]|nr:hypothetical protein [Bacillota bacterium]
MELILSCSSGNFDALAAVVAASKIYTGSKCGFVYPLAEKVQHFLDSHPGLVTLVGSLDFQSPPHLLVLLGPYSSNSLGPYKELVNRASEIHLFSPDPGDRTFLNRATLYNLPAGSTTTILLEEIRRRKLPLTRLEAGLLAKGIYESTAALTSPATTAGDVAAVYYLWENGLDLEILRSGLPFAQYAGETSSLPAGKGVPGTSEFNCSGGQFNQVQDKSAEKRQAADIQPAAPGFEMHTCAEGTPAWLEWDSLLPLLTGSLPDRLQGMLLLIGQAGARRSSEVYLVGGVIRDLLLEKEPVQDLDFVVIPEAVPLARDLQKWLGGKLITYEQLGTATLFLAGGTRLDLTTARQELYPSPGSLPEVEPSGLKFDLYRRDFTINSIACSIIPETYGKLFDYFSGRRDLVDGLLRTMYNLSFVDDPLRILRAVRFEKRLGFRLEDNTRKCMLKAINGRALEKVSLHRLSQEMSLIYSEPDPPEVLKRLNDLGALKFIYPRLQTSSGTWRRLEQVGQVLYLTRCWDWESPPEPEPAYLSALLYDMDDDGRTILVSKLNLSRDSSWRVLTACAKAPQILRSLSRTGLKPSLLVNLLQDLPPEALLLACSLTESNREREHLKSYVNSLR